eukprot:1151311-Pelagomonas_calceolata.AAC.5
MSEDESRKRIKKGHSDGDLAILNDAFCKSRPLVENAAAAGSNAEVAALLSFDSLQDQKGVFAAEMQAFVQSHAPSTAAAPEQAAPTRQATLPSASARSATVAPSQAASEQAVPMSDRAMRAARRAAQAAQAAADANPEALSGSDSESDEPEPEPEQGVQETAAKPLPKAEAFWQEACRL